MIQRDTGIPRLLSHRHKSENRHTKVADSTVKSTYFLACTEGGKLKTRTIFVKDKSRTKSGCDVYIYNQNKFPLTESQKMKK
jgi:hypothetical protein